MTTPSISPDTGKNISNAARWLAANRDKAHPIFTILRNRFGLALPEAAKALAEANRIRDACR